MTAPTPGSFPAEPTAAGNPTPLSNAPIWPVDYDLSAQPNQAASEPPTPPAMEEPEAAAAPAKKAAKSTAPRDRRGS